MSSQTKQTILIVDDEPLNIKVLSQALSPWYRVKAATNGRDAINISNSEDPPDLILLDISMPDMDGYQVCQELKSSHETKDIPIIFLTGKNSTEDEAKGLELGAADYIAKPFSLPIVMARIRNQILLKIKTDMLEKLVSVDSLTEVANRRRFDELLAEELRRSIRSNGFLSVIMIDVDYFKNLNDNYGHAAGDVCLKQVAQSLKNTVRRSADSIARYGGEEFVAILPDITHEDAMAVAEKLRENVARLEIRNPTQANKNNSVTVSLGVATVQPLKGFNEDAILKLADKALYEAKQSGRNRVCGRIQ